MTENVLSDRLRLIGVAGANKVMAGELSRLVRRAWDDVRLPEPKKEGLGAVSYPFDARVAWTAANFHRTCARVEWEVHRSTALRLEPLYDDLVAQVAADTRPFLTDGATFSIEAHHVKEFAAGERQVVGTVKNALIDGAKRRGLSLRVDPEAPQLLFSVRLVEGNVLVSLDLAGRPMHQRGYRVETVAAPLREDLAAILLMLARFDARTEVLVDPMAGSGTLVIEAACMANASPVSASEPACTAFSPFRELRGKRELLFGDTRAKALAIDHDESAIRACGRNVERAGVTASVAIHLGDFRALDPEGVRQKLVNLGPPRESGLVLSNPPYGERLNPKELFSLYRDLGHWVRTLGFRSAFLVANPDFERAFGGRPRIKKPLSNGPLRGNFYLYDP